MVNTPFTLIAFVPVTPPVIPPVTAGADQLYKVPAGTIPLVTFVGVTVKLIPVQLVAVIAVITAVGFRLIVTVKLVPVQLPDTGVTIYVAVCATLVGFVNVPLTFIAFVPLNPPVIPPVTDGAPQLYKVPAGITPFVTFVGVTVNNTPLQVTPVIAVIPAVGFTVTVTVKLVPVQLPDTGVTI